MTSSVIKPSAAAESLNLRIKKLCNDGHREHGIPIEHLIAILSNIIGQFEVAYMVDNPGAVQAQIEAMVIRNARLGAEAAIKYLHQQDALRILNPSSIHDGNESKN